MCVFDCGQWCVSGTVESGFEVFVVVAHIFRSRLHVFLIPMISYKKKEHNFDFFHAARSFSFKTFSCGISIQFHAYHLKQREKEKEFVHKSKLIAR